MERQRHHRKRGWVATDRDVRLAKFALRQMRLQRLVVSLVPAPRPQHQGHMVRVAEQQNPDWYRELVGRRPKSNSVRQYVIDALERIVAMRYVGPSPWCMDLELLDVLHEHQEDEQCTS